MNLSGESSNLFPARAKCFGSTNYTQYEAYYESSSRDYAGYREYDYHYAPRFLVSGFDVQHYCSKYYQSTAYQPDGCNIREWNRCIIV